MISSNQSIGLKKSKTIKTYTFTKKEFDKKLVPAYAYDLVEEEETVSFKCSFDRMGDPIFKK